MIALLIGTLFVLIFISVPVSFAIAISAIILTVATPGLTPLVFVQRTFAGMDSFVVLAIPLFVLTAEIMNCTGITDRLINVAYALVGHIRGGIAHVNVLVSMIFAGISGSSTADTAGIGSILIPAMIKRGYPADFSIAVTAASSTLGQIIPPSIIAVIYAATVGISVGALFLGGIVAGIAIGLLQMIISYIFALKYGYPREARMSMKERLTAVIKAVPPLFTPTIIIGGILIGLFTPTEAAVVSALYSVFLSVCYRSITLKILWGAITKTAKLASVTTFCIGVANVFSYLLSYYRLPEMISGFVTANINSQIGFLLFAFAVFFIVGCFMDATPSIILLAPIIAAAGNVMGVNPIHLGVIVVVTMALGLVTPPFGLCLLLSCKIAAFPIQKTFKVMFIFIGATVGLILVFIFYPEIVLFVPKTFAPNLMP